MHQIRLRDAKATFSAIVDEDVRGEASIITRHRRPEAVVLGFAEWQRLSPVPSFGRLLTSAPLDDPDLAPRDTAPVRTPEL